MRAGGRGACIVPEGFLPNRRQFTSRDRNVYSDLPLDGLLIITLRYDTWIGEGLFLAGVRSLGANEAQGRWRVMS